MHITTLIDLINFTKSEHTTRLMIMNALVSVEITEICKFTLTTAWKSEKFNLTKKYFVKSTL